MAVKLPLPMMIRLFGDIVLPTPFVQTPLVVISRSPPIVVLVPERSTALDVEILLPAVVAVLPVNVMLGLVPLRAKLPPATWMPPPRLPAELFVKVVVATVVAILSTMMPPPLAVPVAALLVNDVLLMLTEPVPRLVVMRSAPPPPAVREFAVLFWNDDVV